MHDIYDVIKNVSGIYDSNTSFEVLKDFERVLDELDIYVYENWQEGELLSGPNISRHWVTCSFMWPYKNMPDPMGGKRLLDYDCKVSYKKDYLIKPRKIRTPDDVRPGSKKGKLDRHAIWVVNIEMPKKLIADIYGGYNELMNYTTEPATQEAGGLAPEAQPADMTAVAAPAPAAPAAGGEAVTASEPAETI